MPAGKHNSLTDVEGILVGHYTDREAACGVSVAVCPEGATAGVDVRGSAPGTRETDLLAPLNLVEKVQAVSAGRRVGLRSLRRRRRSALAFLPRLGFSAGK